MCEAREPQPLSVEPSSICWLPPAGLCAHLMCVKRCAGQILYFCSLTLRRDREVKTDENHTDLKQAWQPNTLTAPFHFKTITLQAPPWWRSCLGLFVLVSSLQTTRVMLVNHFVFPVCHLWILCQKSQCTQKHVAPACQRGVVHWVVYVLQWASKLATFYTRK